MFSGDNSEEMPVCWDAMSVDVEEGTVPGQIATGGIHHLRLTVTDLPRSREFYTSLLGF